MKLHFVNIHRGKTIIFTGSCTIYGFQHALGALEHIPLDKGGLLCSLKGLKGSVSCF